MYFTPWDRTNSLLCTAALLEYANIVTTLQTTVDAYPYPDNNGDLTGNLHDDGLAMMIN
jgi:hypothetical protein